MAGPDVISPSMYRAFAMAAQKKVIDRIHRQGGLVSLHICGNATLILKELCGLGADILEVEQTVAQAGGTAATGVILGPGCALAGDTPKENLKVLLREK